MACFFSFRFLFGFCWLKILWGWGKVFPSILPNTNPPTYSKKSMIIKNWFDKVLSTFEYVFYTPPHFSGEVLCYTLRCLSVRPSVRAHHFRSITWVFIHGIFSNFAYILLSAMSGMGLLMGKIRPFLKELLPFFVLEKWCLACFSFTVHDIWMKLHRYVAHQRLHIVTKDRHSDLPSLWVIRPW